MKQVDELIRRTVSNIIAEEVDLPKGVLFTITKVITSRDLALAKIFYICTPSELSNTAINVIKKKLKIIRERLRREIVLRKIPKIIFIIDKAEQRGARMDELLSKL